MCTGKIPKTLQRTSIHSSLFSSLISILLERYIGKYLILSNPTVFVNNIR